MAARRILEAKYDLGFLIIHTNMEMQNWPQKKFIIWKTAILQEVAAQSMVL
jgi:hypothetical protein